MSDPATPPRATGSRLCGAISYRVDGPLRDVTVCHCSVCRRLHGAAAAYAACAREHLTVVDPDGRRTGYVHASATYERCGACGGQLFWSRPGLPTISIAAGSLDMPSGLRTTHHIFTESAADWEHLDDGLPGFPEGTPA